MMSTKCSGFHPKSDNFSAIRMAPNSVGKSETKLGPLLRFVCPSVNLAELRPHASRSGNYSQFYECSVCVHFVHMICFVAQLFFLLLLFFVKERCPLFNMLH